jgi:hypothetical protein
MSTDLFNRVGDLLEEIGTEKAAGDTQSKAAMDDPGGMEGKSSHPSATIGDDGDLPQPAPEGEMSADNTAEVKKQIPDSVDSKSEATPANVPTQDEVQLGQGVDAAKPTGEDPSTERDYKGTKEDPGSGSTEMGGTSHPAKGSFGEKYSSDQLTEMSDEDLYKQASELGNELLADVANGLFEHPAQEKQAAKPEETKEATAEKAAQAGYTAAAAEGDDTDLDTQAGQVIASIVKTAHHQGDLVAAYLKQTTTELQKAAEGDEDVDPTGGAAEGEDHETEETEGGEGPTEAPPEEGLPAEGGAPGGGEEEALLAAMAGGGEEPGGGLPGEGGPPMGGPEMGGGLPGEGGPPMGGGLPGEGGPPMGGPEMGGGPPMGGGDMGMGMGMGGPPDALNGMGEEEALQQLAMALMELGIDPAMLAQLGGPGPKIASAVTEFQKSGKFQFSETKTAEQKQVRDYMKSYIGELCKRSR